MMQQCVPSWLYPLTKLMICVVLYVGRHI